VKPPIPPFDPLGLPVPSLLALGLSALTLTLHLAAMQFTVGSAILGVLAKSKHPVLTRFFGTGLPLGFSYLVTLGIPPLLFVQVMYGQFFYTSSVLIGAFWIAVVPLIIIGYGAAYWHRMVRDHRPRRAFLMLVVSALCLLTVGYIYVNNLTLSMHPERWLPLYRANPSGGVLHHGEPTLAFRYLLFIVPAPFMAGLALVLRAGFLRSRDPASALEHQRFGVRAMLIATVLVALTVVGLLATLPPNIRDALLRPGLLSGLAIGASVSGLLALGAALASGKRAGLTLPVVSASLAVVGLGCLVVARELVRQLYLAPYFSIHRAPVLAQWEMFAAFAVTLLIGVVFLAVLTKRMVVTFAKNG